MKVSVLVPVYKAEKYIEECAESLFEQTYGDMEFIFVDDCTPDDSIAVVKKVLSRHPHRKQQVHFIKHEQNRGVGATRITANSVATGNFVMYVDSDDYIPRDAVANLCRKQQETEADIIEGAYCDVIEGEEKNAHLPYHGDETSYLKILLARNTLSHALWAKLIRRTLFTNHDIGFVEGINMGEDYTVVARLAFFARRSFVDDIVYCYRQGENSTFAKKPTREVGISSVKSYQLVADFIKQTEHGEQFLYALELGLMNCYVNVLRGAKLTLKEVDALLSHRFHYFVFRLLHLLMELPRGWKMVRGAYLVLKRIYLCRLRKKNS